MANIKDVAAPLRTLNPDDENWSDFAPIRELIGNARVVSVGESAHGVGEFFNLRQRLFRFLVKELGFTAYCTEFPFDEGMRINEWIHGGPGTVNDVTDHGKHVSLGEGREAGAHLEWMRSWNAKNGNRLNFYGLDVGSPVGMVRQCLARIPAKPGDAELLKLADLGEGFTGVIAKLMGMPEPDRARLDQGLADLVNRAKASGNDVAVRCAVGAIASVHSVSDRATNFADGNNRREEYMADNVAWVLQRERRIMIGGHNTHVRRDTIPVPALGTLLQAQLPEPPVVIGTSYGAGSIWRIDNMTAPPNEWTISVQELKPPAGTLDAVMSTVGLPLHFVDLHRVPDQQLAEATSMLVFHDPWPVNVREAFDAVIHVQNARNTDESVAGARKTFIAG